MLDFLFSHTPAFYLIQSLWRDEAFSYFMAQPSFAQIIRYTSQDFNPPLYYFLLHIWIALVGHWDEGLRLLSFLFHCLTVYVAFLLAWRITSTRRFAFFVAAFTFFNPMLLYYAFEIRMYSLYAFATMSTLYFFYGKRWVSYMLVVILGLYTHSYFIFVPLCLSLYRFLRTRSLKAAVPTAIPIIFFLPWIPVLFRQFLLSKGSWLYPVDTQLIKSSLGNLFTGYEGTPGELWGKTAVLSLLIILFAVSAVRKYRSFTFPLILTATLPLMTILVYSVIRQPLYVNRYLIFISVIEVLVVSIGVLAIPGMLFRRSVAVALLAGVIAINIYAAPYHKKTDFKSTLAEINRLASPSDVVYAATPIGYLETAFYFSDTSRVFLYNPRMQPIPNYIGVTVVFPNVSRKTFPDAPSRAFLVNDDATYTIVRNQ